MPINHDKNSTFVEDVEHLQSYKAQFPTKKYVFYVTGKTDLWKLVHILVPQTSTSRCEILP